MKKALFFSLFFLMLVSCEWVSDWNKKYAFSMKTEEHYSTDIQDSAFISITYLKAKKPTAFAKKFNDTIRKRILSFIQMEEKPNYDKTISEAIADFYAESLEDRKLLYQASYSGGSYELSYYDSISFQNDTLISLQTNTYGYLGGPHGYSHTSFLNFKPSGDCYKTNELFTNVDSITKVAEKYFRKYAELTPEDSLDAFWFENDTFHLPENVGFVKDTLLLYYNQYEIASYASGSFEIKIPLNAIEKWLFFTKK